MSIFSSLKLFRDSSRWACDMFPWSWAVRSPSKPRRMCNRWHCCLVRIKTITWSVKVLVSKDAKIASCLDSWAERILRNSCFKLNATALLLSTKILTGDFNETKASSFTWSLIVAEKSMVCLDGAQLFTISFIWSKKHSSKRRSASSSTRTSTVSNVNVGVFFMWSTRRPGVAKDNKTLIKHITLQVCC